MTYAARNNEIAYRLLTTNVPYLTTGYSLSSAIWKNDRGLCLIKPACFRLGGAMTVSSLSRLEFSASQLCCHKRQVAMHNGEAERPVVVGSSYLDSQHYRGKGGEDK